MNSLNIDMFKRKIESIIQKLNNNHKLEFLCLFIAEKGFFRKPLFGMFQYFIDKYFPNLTVNNTNLYIGDAAGRPKKDQKKKDFADTDYNFALNSKYHF